MAYPYRYGQRWLAGTVRQRFIGQGANTIAVIAQRTLSQSTSDYRVFDRNLKREQRNRAALSPESSRQVDYLKDEVAERMVDRLLDIKRKFNVMIDLGSGAGHVIKYMPTDKCDRLIMTDTAEKMLNRDADTKYPVTNVTREIVDEETLPFKENTADAVVSCLSLHWVNDLLGAMIQARRTLKPDGLFMASLIGVLIDNYSTSFQLAEMEREGGMSPRVSPMADVKDFGNLLSRAGYTMTTVDVDEIVVDYPTPFHLMADLKAMGENNAVINHANRRPYLHRDTLMAAASIYKEMHGNQDGTVPATFQILHMIGWKPDVSQPKPLERGSAQQSLKDVLEK
ncbi:S-adenosyl-L-methionine-dependent methyltransferase [Syncephalis fuscata]|nr:S-adenosyl-L-methionine-dependent methyltransferase [Syncephalis fuscata]